MDFYRLGNFVPMIYAFGIWLGDKPIPTFLLRCIESIRRVYPEFKIITEWGDCPYARDPDDRLASDTLRWWIMSEEIEALYLDLDNEVGSELTFDKTDRVWVYGVDGCPCFCMLYHNGQQETCKTVLKNHILMQSYMFTNDKECKHHGYTMNNLGGNEWLTSNLGNRR